MSKGTLENWRITRVKVDPGGSFMSADNDSFCRVQCDVQRLRYFFRADSSPLYFISLHIVLSLVIKRAVASRTIGTQTG